MMSTIFTLDTRALSLLRIALGGFVIMDLVFRLMMGIDWYTSSDINPASTTHTEDSPHGFIVHKWLFARGSVNVMYGVFTAHAIVALLFTIGWRTRLTTIILWLMTISLHGRQENFNDGSDKVLRNVLLWCMFLPMGEGMSYENFNWRKCKDGKNSLIYSAASIGLVLQVSFIYIGVVAQRWMHGPSWFLPDLSAVYYATAGSFATHGISPWLTSQPDLCRIATFMAIVHESFCGILLLITSVKSKWRYIAIIFPPALHFGISLMFYLPQWGGVGSIVMLGFLPVPFFGKDSEKKADSDGKQGLEPSSIAAPVAGNLRQRNVSIMEENKAAHSTEDDKMKKTEEPRSKPPSVINKIFSKFFLVYMVYLFFGSDLELFNTPDDGNIGQAFRFYQSWVMFTNPSPDIPEAYWVVTADTEDRHVVDVLNGLKTGSWNTMTESEEHSLLSRPISTSQRYPSWRYERMFFNLRNQNKGNKHHKAMQLIYHWCAQAKAHVKSSQVMYVRVRSFEYYIVDLKDVGNRTTPLYRVNNTPKFDLGRPCPP